MTAVHRYLVTAAADQTTQMWVATCWYANWIEGRDNNCGRETWLVTVFDDRSTDFLTAARSSGVTVEEIDGAGDAETYRLMVGEPGTGWKGASDE